MSDLQPRRYRLTINTWQAGTSFCIGALSDEDARVKAARICAYYDVTDAEVALSRGTQTISQSGQRTRPAGPAPIANDVVLPPESPPGRLRAWRRSLAYAQAAATASSDSRRHAPLE